MIREKITFQNEDRMSKKTSFVLFCLGINIFLNENFTDEDLGLDELQL